MYVVSDPTYKLFSGDNHFTEQSYSFKAVDVNFDRTEKLPVC